MALLDEIGALAEAHGLDAWGVARAEVLERARGALYERRDAGLHDGMQIGRAHV